MKIEVDLCVDNLGFTAEEKLKLFMHARCKMGRKTEVQLVSYYKSCKEKILDYIEKQLECETVERSVKTEEPGFVIKGNKLVFPSMPMNESVWES
jgi:hypothetical protein